MLLRQSEQIPGRNTVFLLGLLGGTAMPGRLRHTLRGHDRKEAQSVNVIPTAHAGLNRGAEH